MLGNCELTIGGSIVTMPMVQSPQGDLQTFEFDVPAASAGGFFGFQMSYLDPQTGEMLLSNGVDVIFEDPIDWSQVTVTGSGQGSGAAPGGHTYVIHPLYAGVWDAQVPATDKLTFSGMGTLPGPDYSAWASGYFSAWETQMLGSASVYAEDAHTASVANAGAKQVYAREFVYNKDPEYPGAGDSLARSAGWVSMDGVGTTQGWDASVAFDAGFTAEITPLIPPTTAKVPLRGATSARDVDLAGVTVPLPAWGPGRHPAADIHNLDSSYQETEFVRVTVNATIAYALTANTTFPFQSSKASVDVGGAVTSVVHLRDDPN